MYRTSIDKKIKRLRKILLNMESVLLAYSGGVDSTLLLKVANDVLKDRCLAVTVGTETYPKKRIKKAVNLARNLDILRHKVIDMKILEVPGFVNNSENRCYLCKREIFQNLLDLAKDEGLRYVIEGTNYDDVSDFRPGIKALEELKIRSPLKDAILTKGEIRYISREMDLSTWDKPPFTCLVSRIPYGVKITLEALQMIDEAERLIHELGLRQVRVRHYGDLARIELNRNEIPWVFERGLNEKIVSRLKELGYTYITIDLEGYRRGSMDIKLKEKGVSS
ncbi:MAG: ATP-dependent sacrificial sulfur transferase LarE [bacterium]|nr:ATP-dependent sacrificial sulfur transferase LarE [bacterium]